ncbi:MAG: hypothetical protein ACK5DD_15885 [Cyclobacteriaceae bacterium]
MKKSVVVLASVIISLLISGNAQSQSSALYLMPSFQFYSYSNLNQSLRAAGFPEVGATFGSGAGGFGTVNNRWRVGGEGTYFSGANHTGTTTTSAEGGLGLFYAGYVLTQKSWRWVPQAGIGYGGLAVTATRSVSTNSIGDLLTNAPNSSTVSMGDGFVHTSLSIERNLSDAMFIGLKASYNLGLSGEREWETNGLANAVRDPFSSFQLSFNIGFVLR